MHQDIEEIKQQLSIIQHILSEEYELSDDAKSALAVARKTLISAYISQEDVKKRLLR